MHARPRYAAHAYAWTSIAIEPCNRYEVFLVNTAVQAVELADMIDEDNVGIHLDTNHMNIEEQDFETPDELVRDGLACLQRMQHETAVAS